MAITAAAQMEIDDCNAKHCSTNAAQTHNIASLNKEYKVRRMMEAMPEKLLLLSSACPSSAALPPPQHAWCALCYMQSVGGCSGAPVKALLDAAVAAVGISCNYSSSAH
eukprot:12991-Heterococcus_DN1.PRE.2